MKSTIVMLVALTSASALAQPTRTEAEHLVPPQGGAFEIPVHAGAVCILSFPEKLAGTALSSSPDFEIKSWGDDGVAVRAIGGKVAPATLALATVSKSIKVNVTLRVVPSTTPAMTMVRFKGASAEEAFSAQVDAAAAKRLAPIEAELAKARKNIDAQIRDRSEELLAERLIQRVEVVPLEAHERNAEHVIVHVRRGVLVGGDGFVVFDIENRGRGAYRLASVRVTDSGRDVSGPARLVSRVAEPGLVGVVPAGATVGGLVMVRSVDSVLRKPLTLELAGPGGSGRIQLRRGIVLR